MTAVLLDTCILIDLLRGRADATAWFNDLVERLGNDPANVLAVSAITVHELIAGLRPDERERTDALLSAFDVVTVDENIARASGALSNRYRKSHNLDALDSIIAASAAHTGAELVTTNLKHFPMFPDLERPYR